MNLKNFRDGLDILANYFEDPSKYHLGAEHDQFYVYATDRPLSEDDQKRLDDLGWFQETDEYDPQEGWSCFV